MSTKTLAAILNMPWSFLGFLVWVLSWPNKIQLDTGRGVAILKAKRLWLGEIFLWRRVRGQTFGSVILLSNVSDESTLAHEFIHIRQYNAWPLIFPIIYIIALVGVGYQNNKYEKEARRD